MGGELYRNYYVHQDIEQFGKDFERSTVVWRKNKIEGEDALKELKEHFGEDGYRNIALLCVQSLSADSL